MPALQCFIIKQLCDFLSGLILIDKITDGHLNKVFLFSLLWSFGSFFEIDDRTKLDSFLTAEFGSILLFPTVGRDMTTFDYYVNKEGVHIIRIFPLFI